MSRNVAAVFGGPGCGKSSVVRDLVGPDASGSSLSLRTRYYSTDVELLEIPHGEEVVESAAWIFVCLPAKDSFVECRERVPLDQKHPTLKLAVFNEAGTAHTGLAEQMVTDPDVVDWAVTHGFELIARRFAEGDPFSSFDRAGIWKHGLLEEEPTGTARLLQALFSTAWPTVSVPTATHRVEGVAYRSERERSYENVDNLTVLLWHGKDGSPPTELAHILGAKGAGDHKTEWHYDIDNKYYTATANVLSVDVERMRENLEVALLSAHALVLAARSCAALKGIQQLVEGLPDLPADVKVVVKLSGETLNAVEVTEWALDHGMEVVACKAEEEEEEGIPRLHDALQSTMWPAMQRKGAKTKKAPEGDDRGVDEQGDQSEPTPQPPPSRPVHGCDLPPGWVFDSTLQRSRPMDRSLLSDPSMRLDDLTDPTRDFDKLYREAMFLRNQGGNLDRNERLDRAAEVAMRMFEQYDE